MPVICFVVTHPTQFEVPLYQYIARHPSEWSWEVIYTRPRGEIHDKELSRNVQWGFDLFEGYQYDFAGGDQLEHTIALLKQKNVDLLIVNGRKGHYAVFVRAAKALSIPVGLRFDNVLMGYPVYDKWMRQLLLAKEYRLFDAFFATGTCTRQYADAMGIPKEKVFRFPYCTDNDFFATPATETQLAETRASINITVPQKVVLGICKFNERENPFDLLKAFCYLNDSSLQLVMIGDGPLMAALKKYASGFPHLFIHFPGYIAYAQLRNWYALTEVFVHTALHEPWGVSVQEALAAGCRIVASERVGSAYDLVRKGDTGFIYPVNAYKKLAAYIQKARLIPEATFQQRRAEILGYWNYKIVWQELQEAAGQVVKKEKGIGN